MPPPRRVLFATIGSLGDQHPLFAVGNGLLARGHAVALATSAEHRERVEAAGLAWRHMRPDLPPGADPAALFAKVFDPREGPEFTFRRVVAPAIRDSHADLERAARDADLLVSTTAAFAAPLVAARRPGLAWASAAPSRSPSSPRGTRPCSRRPRGSPRCCTASAPSSGCRCARRAG